jgi:hypothetical protein
MLHAGGVLGRAKDHRPGGAEARGSGPRPRLAVGPPRRDGQHARERRGEDAARGPVALAGAGAAGVQGRQRGAGRRRVAPHDAQPRPGRMLRARGLRRPGPPPRRRGERRRLPRRDARVRGRAVGARVPADGARGAGGRAGAVGQRGRVRGARRRGHPETRQTGAVPPTHQLRLWPARTDGGGAMILV